MIIRVAGLLLFFNGLHSAILISQPLISPTLSSSALKDLITTGVLTARDICSLHHTSDINNDGVPLTKLTYSVFKLDVKI